MKIRSAIALLSTALYATVSANNVVNLNNVTEFEHAMSSHDLVLINFYSPTCGTCEDLKPAYEEAAAILQEDNVVLAQVDCVANDAICDKYKIKAYPTLRLFRHGRPSNLLLDESDQESITQFIKRY
jgi:thioredoxin-like negative regulator of GroEL